MESWSTPLPDGRRKKRLPSVGFRIWYKTIPESSIVGAHRESTSTFVIRGLRGLRSAHFVADPFKNSPGLLALLCGGKAHPNGPPLVADGQHLEVFDVNPRASQRSRNR